jgi:predicted RNA-binding Zn-ribbon protein involved in translation (DUF1610 family)
VAFACPGCGAEIGRSLEAWALRCPSCRAVIRARATDAAGTALRAYEVEVTGRPETRRRIEVPWTDGDARRIRAWLAWSSIITLGLVAVLYVLARWP